MLYIIVTILIATYILYRWRFSKFVKLSKELKHDHWSLPVLGISYLFFGNGEDKMKGLQTIGREAIKQGGITSGWLAHLFFVVVADAEIADLMFKNCHEKHDLMKCLRLLIGNSNLSSQAPIQGRRKVMSLTFSSRNVNQYVAVFAEQSQVLAEQLRPTVGNPVPMFKHVIEYTINTLCQTTMGINFDLQKGHPFLTAWNAGAAYISERVMQPWLHSDLVYKLLPGYRTLLKHKKTFFDFIGEIIVSTRQRIKNDENEIVEKNKKSRSFVELLIEASANEEGYTDLVIKEDTLTLLLAGTDTLSVNISFLAMMLARYPDVQEKVYQELKDIYDLGDRLVETEDLAHMKYMDAVVKECLRLYPPAPATLRKTDKDITLPSGVVVPKGCGLLMHLWAINRNPRYWGADAEEFRPERFLDPSPKHPGQFMSFSHGPRNCIASGVVVPKGCGLLMHLWAINRNPRYWGADAEEFRPERFLDPSPKHPGQFMSFSHGPRNCIGSTYATLSTKTVLATLLRQYRFLPAPEGTRDKPIRARVDILMKEVNNFPVILELRR